MEDLPGKIPIFILAGQDPLQSRDPEYLPSSEIISGNKGLIPLPTGVCLAQELILRLRKSGCFCDPILIGPAEDYRKKIDCKLVDCHGSLKHTLNTLVEIIRKRLDPEKPLAIITYDILPTVDEITALIRDSYLPEAECIFWGQLINSSPEQMGAGHWKPFYRLRISKNGPSHHFYPGHLLIIRPCGLRIRELIYLMDLVYRFRNGNLGIRGVQMSLRGLGYFLYRDLANLFSGKPSLLLYSFLINSLIAYFKLIIGSITVHEFESSMKTGFVRHAFQSHHCNRPLVMSQIKTKSFAKDIDTRSELLEATD